MTPEAQRIAIAEACGYAPYQGAWATPDDRDIADLADLPDYLNDLNAMHEAEKVLTEDDQKEYVRLLHPPKTFNANWRDDFVVMRSTAAQRAEAFLRTLGKWQDAGKDGAK